VRYFREISRAVLPRCPLLLRPNTESFVPNIYYYPTRVRRGIADPTSTIHHFVSDPISSRPAPRASHGQRQKRRIVASLKYSIDPQCLQIRSSRRFVQIVFCYSLSRVVVGSESMRRKCDAKTWLWYLNDWTNGGIMVLIQCTANAAYRIKPKG
jgi:hypothetical protein